MFIHETCAGNEKIAQIARLQENCKKALNVPYFSSLAKALSMSRRGVAPPSKLILRFENKRQQFCYSKWHTFHRYQSLAMLKAMKKST